IQDLAAEARLANVDARLRPRAAEFAATGAAVAATNHTVVGARAGPRRAGLLAGPYRGAARAAAEAGAAVAVARADVAGLDAPGRPERALAATAQSRAAGRRPGVRGAAGVACGGARVVERLAAAGAAVTAAAGG